MLKKSPLMVVLLLALASWGCGSSPNTPTASGGSPSSSGGKAAESAGSAVKLQGVGATFPEPLYKRWFNDYAKAHPHVEVNYQGKGSGAGIKDFTSKAVDFGASDAAMTDDEIAKVEDGVQLLPMTAGEIVLTYNLPKGPEELKLSREAYTKIFLNQITNWNDPIIAKANAGATLPDLPITVVTRSDSSGTTFVFTQHLSAISDEWKKGPGTSKSPPWPKSDKFIGGAKNDGVTKHIKDIEGAIGYIEYGYAQQSKLSMASLENKAGKFVKPSLESGKATLATVKMPENLRAWIPDPEGENAYPIITYTWLLCYKKYADKAKGDALKDVVKFCITEGQKMSGELGYVPLPENVVAEVTKAVDSIK